jgi:hypothetical protein
MHRDSVLPDGTATPPVPHDKQQFSSKRPPRLRSAQRPLRAVLLPHDCESSRNHEVDRVGDDGIVCEHNRRPLTGARQLAGPRSRNGRVGGARPRPLRRPLRLAKRGRRRPIGRCRSAMEAATIRGRRRRRRLLLSDNLGRASISISRVCSRWPGATLSTPDSGRRNPEGVDRTPTS